MTTTQVIIIKLSRKIAIINNDDVFRKIGIMKSTLNVVVFSGYNMRAVVAFIRTLEKNGIDYFIIALSENDYILKTTYKSKVKYIRKHSELVLNEVSDIINLLRRENNRLFIAPTTEFLNRFLLEHRDFFEKNNCIIPLAEKALYERISDKDSFADLCSNYNIAIPQTYYTRNSIKLPIVAKPQKYVSSDGHIYTPIFINNFQEYENFLQTHKYSDFAYQEMLGVGESIYLLFYFGKNGKEYVTSQRNLLQQSGGKSIIAAVSAKYHKERQLIMPYIHLFKDVGFNGLVMVEIRRIDNVDYMIEANPRFWGPSQLFCDSGYNLYEIMLYDYGIISNKPILIEKEYTTYFWGGGLCDGSNTYLHKGYKELFKKNSESFISNDIYERPDTMEIAQIEKLKNLYMNSSKHSNYQILSGSVSKLFNDKCIQTKSRFERERLDYIINKLNIRKMRVLDIGGNTGFFTFEAIEKGALHVDYYEGNPVHAEFVELASHLLNLDSKISIHPEYFLFNDASAKYNIIFNLNVVHHIGDDFGNDKGISNAKSEIVKCINNMADITDYMVFQMGYNWKGNRNTCLFDNGTKEEMVAFISDNCKRWNIISIGIAQKDSLGEVVYCDMNNQNIKRDDSLGEFLNRPIFIMEAR